jgi:putative copper resistance protein D
MPFFYWLSVTLHVLAAFVWLGGMLFLGAVGAPVLRGVEPPELRQRLFQLLGERFRTVGWLMIALLVLTGLANMHYRGLLRWEGVLGSAAFWRTGLGTSLAWKLATVAFMLVASAVHDFALGPRAGRATAGSPEALHLRRRAAMLARVNAIVGIGLVIAAVRLARGA